jgi:hypothetical protein
MFMNDVMFEDAVLIWSATRSLTVHTAVVPYHYVCMGTVSPHHSMPLHPHLYDTTVSHAIKLLAYSHTASSCVQLAGTNDNRPVRQLSMQLAYIIQLSSSTASLPPVISDGMHA